MGSKVSGAMGVLPTDGSEAEYRTMMATVREAITVTEAVEATQVIPDGALDARLSLESDH